MSDAAKSTGELLEAINSSRGMAHLNRSSHRTFSLNIFRMNAQELIEITRRVHDPDEGLRLMFLQNREAGQQTHREVTRRVHNFVAAALTLVEHTRIFIREHYNGAPVLDRYQAKVDAEFAQEPVVRFVQDLRNFMLHKGLLNSEMYLHFEADPNLPQGGTIDTGIRIKAASLLEWKKWTVPAHSFIESSGEFVDIRTFADAYTDKIVAFHEWLQGELDKFHQADLDELRALQESMNRLAPMPIVPQSSSAAITETPKNSDRVIEEDFTLAPNRAAALDAAALSIFGKVRKIDLPPLHGDEFASQRPAGPTITAEEILSAPIVWGNDVRGRRVLAFAYKDGGVYGLYQEDFIAVETLIDSVMKSGWARRTLSRSFINKTIVEWLQSRFSSPETSSLSEILMKNSREAVKPLVLWAPIANLEVQTSFPIGSAEIATLSKAMIDELESRTLGYAPQQREKTVVLFNRLRERMQGLAAVVFKMNAETDKIKEDGEAIARIAVELLKFFSPGAVNFPMVCASALLGAEVVPSSNLLVLGESSFAYSESVLFPNSPPVWRISEADLLNMWAGLEVIGTLVRPEGLSAFALAVRSSLLLFGRGTTFPSPAERLTYTLSSIEALLLRHFAEPIEFNVGERMARLLAQQGAGREDILRSVREAYRLRGRQDISPLSPHEMGSLATFLRHAHRVIGIALGNLKMFGTVPEFVNAIEGLKARSDRAA